MNKTKLLSVSTLLIVAIAFSACNRKKGCMDPDSLHYDASAQVDDGSCRYEGKVNYWWNKSFLDSCQAHSITDIIVMINGQELDRIPMTTQFWSSAPGCGPFDVLNSRVDLGSDKSRTYSQYQNYFNATGLVATSPTYTISFSGNGCTSCQFIW
jgi:hypothetical protein